MTHDSQGFPPVFRIDVSAEPSGNANVQYDPSAVMIALMRQVVQMQARTNQLLEEMLQQHTAMQRQRQNELGQWKDANPELAKCCRTAAETLSRVQTQFLRNLTDEVVDNEESLVDGEFMLNEFVDRYGPRLAHRNGVLQVLSQLSATTN
jgi:exonuclease VII large subunit